MNNVINQRKTYKNNKRTFFLFNKSYDNLLEEELEILKILEKLKEDFNYVNHCLDYVTDPLLIDSYIYQLLSINMRYQFYLQLCKETGLFTGIL